MKERKYNKNTDALSRVEFYPTDTSTVCKPPIQYNPILDETLAQEEERNGNSGDNLSTGQIDFKENNDDATIHTSLEDSILSVGSIEKPLNTFQNQIMVIKVEENLRVIMKKIFEKLTICTRWQLKVTDQSSQVSYIKFLKIYGVPKRQYVFYF